jgi:hypothetical protein
MPKISKVSNNWPENPIVEAATYNTIYSELATVSAGIGDGNVRTEGIDTRNIMEDPLVVFRGTQYNGYEGSLGASPIPAATNYGNFADDATKESEINHNSGGFTSTVPGQGTKLIIGDGTAGITLAAGDIVRLSWQVQVWKVRSNTNTTGNVASLNMHASDLVTVAARSDTATDGSGIGEWCYLIYPKVNTTSNALTDSDFGTISAKNLYYATVADPGGATVGMGNGLLMAGSSFDHCSVVDMALMTQGDSTTTSGMVFQATGDNNASSGVRRPYTVTGGITLKATQAMTLFGVQLYTSGVWRMNVAGSNAKLFLENVECDPVNNRFGVSMTVTLASAQLDAMIMRGVTS